jgi:hypothetical protein
MGVLLFLLVAALVIGGVIIMWVLSDTEDGPGRGP